MKIFGKNITAISMRQQQGLVCLLSGVSTVEMVAVAFAKNSINVVVSTIGLTGGVIE